MNWLYYLGAFIAGILITYLLSGFYIRKILRYEKKAYNREIKQKIRFWYLKPFPLIGVLKEHKDNYQMREVRLDNALSEMSRKLEETSRALKNQQDRVETLEKENQKFRDMLKRPGNTRKAPVPDPGKRSEQTAGNRNIRIRSLYFSIPEPDGSFFDEKGETVQDERKFYCIISGDESETGELSFISGKFDRKAIENIDYYLIPVCEVENISQRNNASRIIQTDTGRVTKVQGKWKIGKKVKVKLM